MILCVCSNTPRPLHTRCSSSCRMFSPTERRRTSSTALTWWWWLTSRFDKYLTFHLETRWELDTPHSYWLFSVFKGIVSHLVKHCFLLQKLSCRTATISCQQFYHPLTLFRIDQLVEESFMKRRVKSFLIPVSLMWIFSGFLIHLWQ